MPFEFLNSLKRDLINFDLDEDDLDDYDEDLEESTSKNKQIDKYENELINFFTRLGYIRDEAPINIITLFANSYNISPKETLKALFYMRDKYQGKGERRGFRIILNYLGTQNDVNLRRNINLIPLYGRYDDLYSLFNTPLEDEVIKLFKTQLEYDKNTESPSTLAKWLKSENTSSFKSRELGKRTRLLLGLSSKEYRQLLTELRSKLSLVEHKVTNKYYSAIEYGFIPAGARKKYYKAFNKNDKERYSDFRKLISKIHQNDDFYSVKPRFLTRGISLKEAIYPYDIIESILKNEDDYTSSIYSNLWACLPKYIGEEIGDSLAVLGIAESEKNLFDRTIFKAGVATALYLRDQNKGKFKNYILSMKEPANFKKILGDNLKERIQEIYKNSICSNINMEAAMDLILFAGIKNNINKTDMPKRLFVIIGEGCKVSLLSNHSGDNIPFKINEEEYNRIKMKWTQAGFELPNIIFWFIEEQGKMNVILKDQYDIQYAFGYTNDIFVSLIRNEVISTIDLLDEILNSDRYSDVN